MISNPQFYSRRKSNKQDMSNGLKLSQWTINTNWLSPFDQQTDHANQYPDFEHHSSTKTRFSTLKIPNTSCTQNTKNKFNHKAYLLTTVSPLSSLIISGIILCIGSANERRRYTVTSSLIGWAHTENNPYRMVQSKWKWLLLKGGTAIRIGTHNKYPIAHPDRWAMGHLLQVFFE